MSSFVPIATILWPIIAKNVDAVMRNWDFFTGTTRNCDFFIAVTRSYGAIFRNYGSQCDRSYAVTAPQFHRNETHGLTAKTFQRSGFPILFAIALALEVFGVFVGCIGFIIVRNSRESQMRRVIANESMKYSRRSPVPCTWRLNIIRTWRRGRGRGGGIKHIVYKLIIELSQTNATYLNQRAPQATSYFSQQHNIYLPLNSTSNAAFCSQCGAPTQDSTANFCRSCGNALKKY
ncbi:unnamed protein product [Rotaria socialis]|uniref:Zinc-ribbon domain-containing protein n=1 Tax=Rotaria socialis TaxID=392032 RepID=A0A817THL9_9BILA|nr:unnamed protein product [Rotaria socialis]